MSNDTVSVTSQRGWFARLGSAFGGVLTGLALILASIILLGWNEGRSVQSIRSNNEGARIVTPVAATALQASNEGRLVHLTAPAVADGHRIDTDLGIQAEALGLQRKVQYFQWIETSRSETRTKLGGGEETVTTYAYDKAWTDSPQDSSSFHQPAGHQNPAATLADASFLADQARLGAFRLDRDGLQQVSAQTPLNLTEDEARAAAAQLGQAVSLAENGLYIGANPAAPQVGDMKVTYLVAPQNQVLSVIGAQTNGVLRPYPTRAGAPLLMVTAGTASADEMFAQARSANQVLTWILRVVGVVVMIAAFGMVLAPLGVLADVVPLFGKVVRMGTGLVAAALGLCISAVVIAASWIVFRPLVGLGLLAMAGAAIGFLVWRARAQASPRLAQATNDA